MNRHQYRQIGGRFTDTYPADGIDEHILVVCGDIGMPVHDRQQHRQPVLFQPDGKPPCVRCRRIVDKRLDFDQQGTHAFQRRHDA